VGIWRAISPPADLETTIMSKQLKLSASLSVLAMLGAILAAGPAAADDLSLGTAPLQAIASACTSSALGDLLPALQPVLQ
jgi:hypothetical protein